ncbi:S8 family serine peptidase, partial [Methanosarcina sp. 2.H.T.1A.3]|uniref:S8 family serine peptidase n=1 Tax=Methanosarcina sp. 2.H.T.1A.3 TaxID=1483597 RepID=UPI001390F6DF
IIGSKTDEKADLGMAPAIEIYSYDIDSYYTEIVNSGVDISTNSWGNNNKSLLGNYTSSSSYDFDNAIRNNDIICFKSAGNENDGNLYNTITPPGTAKNIITVGAATEDLFSDTAYFSSFGPCDDGRIKPEIVAPGYNIFLGVVEYYNS